MGMLAYADPNVEVVYLNPDTDNELLGKSVRYAMQQSKVVGFDEFQKIFHSGVIEKREAEWEAFAMQKYGYKTRRAMYSSYATCVVSSDGEQIEIQPTSRKSMDSFTASKDTGPHALYFSFSITDEEFGIALREAFENCTG